MSFVSTIIIAEVVCLTAAITLVWKDKHFFGKAIACYLAIALGTELLGAYVSSKHHHNLWLFNLFIFFEISAILYGLYNCIKKYINPAPIFFIGAGIVYVTYFSFFFFHPLTDFNSITVSVMSVVFALYCLWYYYLLLKDENFIDIKNHPEFWWVTGVLFYYFGSTMSNIFDGLFTVKIFGTLSLRYCIYILLNLILYCLWIYSFICRMKQRKLQS